jgi:hypothetical protein
MLLALGYWLSATGYWLSATGATVCRTSCAALRFRPGCTCITRQSVGRAVFLNPVDVPQSFRAGQALALGSNVGVQLFAERRGLGSEEVDLLFRQEPEVNGTSDPMLCLGQGAATVEEVMQALPEVSSTHGFGDVRPD